MLIAGILGFVLGLLVAFTFRRAPRSDAGPYQPEQATVTSRGVQEPTGNDLVEEEDDASAHQVLPDRYAW